MGPDRRRLELAQPGEASSMIVPDTEVGATVVTDALLHASHEVALILRRIVVYRKGLAVRLELIRLDAEEAKWRTAMRLRSHALASRFAANSVDAEVFLLSAVI